MGWSDSRPGASQAALVVLGLHNLVQNFLLNERGYVPGNVVVSGVLAGIGRTSGLSWSEMGMGPGDVEQGLRIGKRAAGATAAAVVLALIHPRTRGILRDERAAATSWREIGHRALVRFPLGTALFEELAFRGVLPALLRKSHRSWQAEALSAAAFGMWHIIPTHRALAGNPLGRDLRIGGRLGGIATGCLVAALSGLGLGWMRRSTGSLLAPWLAHTSFNSLSYLAGVTALRVSDSTHREQDKKARVPGSRIRAPNG